MSVSETSISETRKSNTTQMTFPLSESGGSPSGSFKIEDVDEHDVGPLSLTKESSSEADYQTTPGLSILHRRASAPNMGRMIVGGPVADSLPSVPRRRCSYTSEFSGRESRTLEQTLDIVPADQEDYSIHESNYQEDDDLSSRPPMDRTISRRLSDSERRFAAEKDEISPPKRADSLVSLAVLDVDRTKPEVARGSHNLSAGSVSTEAIESLILSQIPEHIRNQMTPEMWKQIFTVNAITKHSEVASVCSDITDDLRSTRSAARSLQSPPAKRRSIDHSGLIEEISPSNDLDIVRENLESHSTFRTEDTKDLLSIDTKDFLGEADPTSYRSTSSTKDDDTVTSTSSPMVSPSTRKPTSSSKSPPRSGSEAPKAPPRGSDSHRSARHQSGARGDAPPRPPKKNPSLRARNGNGADVACVVSIEQPFSGFQVSKKAKLSIRFNPEATVRNYERILDVHPSTSSGPSLGIGWKFVESNEKLTFGRPPERRSADMLLSRQVRERMVRVDLGYTSKEIAGAIRENLKIKNQRRRTVNNLKEYGSIAPVEKVEYLMEKCQRKLGRLRLGRKSSSAQTV